MFINDSAIDPHINNIIKILKFLKKHKETLSKDEKKKVFASYKFKDLMNIIKYLSEDETEII